MIKSIQFRLFLEGIEIPFIGGEITTRPSNPTQFGFQIAPSEKTRYILPKTRVLLLFTMSGEETERVLFDGEVIDISFDKDSTSRSTIIYASDISGALPKFPVYIMNEEQNTAENVIRGFRESGEIIFIPLSFSTYFLSLIEKFSQDPSTTLNKQIFKLLASAFKLAPVFAQELWGHKFLSRLLILTSNKTKTYLQNNFVREALSGAMGTQQYLNSIWDFIIGISSNLDLIFFTNFPGFITSKTWYNFMMLPNLFFASVPDCNILHYNIINSFKIAFNWHIRPTRMRWKIPIPGTTVDFTAQVVNQDGTSEEKPSEASFYGIRPKFLLNKMLSTTAEGKSVLKESDYYKYYSSEEAARGVVEKFMGEFPFLLPSILTPGDPTNEIKRVQYLGKKMDYEFQKAKYEAAVFRAVGPFNPYCSVGLPILFIDDTKEATGKGLLLGISHSFTPNSAFTNYEAGYYHDVNDPNVVPDDYNDIVEPKYLYETIVGTKMSKYEKNIDKIFNKSAEDIYKIIKRPLMSLSQYIKFFALEQKTSGILSGDIYNKTRQDKIKKYLNEIKGNIILK